ncbi:MAG: Type 1 glutamine amidotransferase-like domain-containing protein [Lachnospiraceae bacterium]|nr:Type 1 glutamine amidotransferase-like domain-containing protein [Lachnospiraceae bacterium]
MSTYILTSMFPNGFHAQAAEVFREKISKRNKFAFVASEFELLHEKTDKYFRFFLDMFESIGIHFEEAYAIDGRMNAEEAQRQVAEADVIWLSGGDTPTQFGYFQTYGLDKVLREHGGVIIGMSAGSINMAKTSICTLACGHYKQEIYHGLGCVDISVEPHFVRGNVSEELLTLSEEYTIYGLCDDGLIVCSGEPVEFYGEVYRLSHRTVERI